MMKKMCLFTLLYILPAVLMISCQILPLAPEEEMREMKTPVVSAPPPAPSPAPPVSEAAPKQTIASYGKIPPYFIENRGQVDQVVRFYVKGPRGTVYLTGSEVVFDFLQEKEPEAGEEEKEEEEEPFPPGRERERKKVYDRLVFRLKLEGANPQAEIAGEEELPGKINYFIGSQENWRANIPTFQRVVFRSLYPGIDLSFSFTGASLESTFIVEPRADPGKIVLVYEGIDELQLKPEGDLVAITKFGGFVEKAPRLYQEVGGREVEIEGAYRLLGEKSYTYDVGSYDPNIPLLIE